jgi:hypothetical protein
MTSTDENVRIRAVGEYLKGVTIFKKGKSRRAYKVEYIIRRAS